MGILKQIKPTKEEELFVNKNAEKFLCKIKKKLKNAKAVIGGSFAKNTWLSGNYDVDIFVKFNYRMYKDKDISRELGKILGNFKKKILHGSRDYFQINQGDISFEIVPVLDVKNYKQALNVTDISPLHSEFVKKHSNKKMQDEIRIAKQFLKANDLYGAESYIRGFSGYLTELLIINYKTFQNMLKNASKWPDSIVIDIKKHYKNPEDALGRINWAKQGPLLMIDPVQKNRNVAAALSREKFDAFKKLVSQYVKNPDEAYFTKKDFELSELKDYTILEISPKNGKRDVVGAKLLKLFEFIKSKITEEGFNLIDSGWRFDKKTYFWYKVENEELELTKKHYGPLLIKKMHLKTFKEKWENYKVYKEKDRVYILIERKFPRFKNFLKNLTKEKIIKESLKKIRIL